MIGGLVIEIEIEIGDGLAVVRASHSMAGVVRNENENEIVGRFHVRVDGENWSGIDDCFESESEIGEFRGCREKGMFLLGTFEIVRSHRSHCRHLLQVRRGLDRRGLDPRI